MRTTCTADSMLLKEGMLVCLDCKKLMIMMRHNGSKAFTDQSHRFGNQKAGEGKPDPSSIKGIITKILDIIVSHGHQSCDQGMCYTEQNTSC